MATKFFKEVKSSRRDSLQSPSTQDAGDLIKLGLVTAGGLIVISAAANLLAD